MTRINLIDPSRLSRQHLIAEYREITRLPGNLKTSLNRKKPFSLTEIPASYTLGPGHVKFFYDKMAFLEKRFLAIVGEMIARGYKPSYTDPNVFKDVPVAFYGDYTPTTKDIELNKQRILERGGTV